MAKYLFLLLSILSVSQLSIQSSIDAVNGTIKITVGTTAGCTDTVRFISDHLVEAYDEYKEFLDIVFVPWGRTRYEPDGSMWCQFGANDCWANRVHRCALDMLSGNLDAQVFYMACEFNANRPAYEQGTYLCAQAVGLDFIELDHCVASTGRRLDDIAQAAAEQPMSIINFVPSIHFNEVMDRAIHDQARVRLKSMICFALAEHPSTGITNCQI